MFCNVGGNNNVVLFGSVEGNRYVFFAMAEVTTMFSLFFNVGGYNNNVFFAMSEVKKCYGKEIRNGAGHAAQSSASDLAQTTSISTSE